MHVRRVPVQSLLTPAPAPVVTCRCCSYNENGGDTGEQHSCWQPSAKPFRNKPHIQPASSPVGSAPGMLQVALCMTAGASLTGTS